MKHVAFITLFFLGMNAVVQAGASNFDSRSQIDNFAGHNLMEKELILSWSPQIIDNIEENDTAGDIMEYSITTAQRLNGIKWYFDGSQVAGNESGNTYSHSHEWDRESTGFHTIIFEGNSSSSRIEFRWYVNVYENGENRGESVFDVINDALENELTDIKIRMFKYQISKHGGLDDFTLQKVNTMHDEMAGRKMMRESLQQEFRMGNITIEEYAAALKKAQREAKYSLKFAKEMARFTLIELKNENLSREFENFSYIEGKTYDNDH